MSRKRIIVAILATIIAACLIRVAGVGHEGDSGPWWWGWPLSLWVTVLRVVSLLTWGAKLGLMAVPLAAVVYAIGKMNGLWVGAAKLGRAVSTGAIAALVNLLPVLMLQGVFFGIDVPFRGRASGLEAVRDAFMLCLFAGVLGGGFLVAALLGALSGALTYAVLPRERKVREPSYGWVTALVTLTFLVAVSDVLSLFPYYIILSKWR